VFGDAHAHAEALDAVIGAAEACVLQELWSLGDMTGRGPDPAHVVARTRERCATALMGNHDYGATGSAEPTRAARTSRARTAVRCGPGRAAPHMRRACSSHGASSGREAAGCASTSAHAVSRFA
jgi:hypothetical protein